MVDILDIDQLLSFAIIKKVGLLKVNYYKMKLNFKKGFTLIELLVVIAIIGILSGIVLSSLNSARNKGKDARVQASMAQVRSIAETLYDGSAYPASFVTPSAAADCALAGGLDSSLGALATDIRTQNGITACNADNGQLMIDKTVAGKYAATAKLPSGTYWCVDSSGASKGGFANRAAAWNTTNTVCN